MNTEESPRGPDVNGPDVSGPDVSGTALAGPFVIDRFDLRGATIDLHYLFGDPENPTHRFIERIEFDSPLNDTPEVRAAARVLHLIAGVSYYKSIAPARIIVDAVDSAQRSLLVGMFDQGLREFAYRNSMSIPLPVDIEETGSQPDRGFQPAKVQPPAEQPPAQVVSDAVLIPVGGGKDSALVADLIPDGVLMSVNPTGAHQHLASSMGRPLVTVKRTLDPQLREHVAGGAPNGHVPVTAINSAIAVVLAASKGFGYVAMGLERSASEPTLVAEGVEVNHQFSKSAEGERLLGEAFAATGVNYFSLLRPMTELAIGLAVAERGLASDIVSCNRAFTIWSENEASRTQRPCGDCAKCLFTALMLAPALSPEEIQAHFGRDLLDEVDHIDPVRELWSAEKPFDCVGERHETAAALVLLTQQPAWSAQAVPAALGDEARSVLGGWAAHPEKFLEIESTDSLLERFRHLIDDLRADPSTIDGAVSTDVQSLHDQDN